VTTQRVTDGRPPQMLSASYVLPLRLSRPADAELSAYLLRLSDWLEVVVADGSPPEVFAAHEEAWGDRIVHVAVKSVRLNGKVAGVIDGLAVATYDAVVIADDDVRFERADLERLIGSLDTAAAVVPQNYFDPLPWHARWDTGRTLLNRAFGVDYAGTAAVRRSQLPDAEYCGAVLFENLEMLRTITAAGGTVRHARGLYVRRVPPDAAHFWQQRFRQAYDSFAQPGRFAAELAVLPLGGLAARSRAGRRTAIAASAAVLAAAEFGRRRAGGGAVFATDAALWAPVWLAERAVCAWAAVVWRLQGGVPYAGGRLLVAAHREDELVGCSCAERACGCRASPKQVA
jgi:Glycosyl transferase family 2